MDKEKRHKVMSSIKSEDTSIEVVLRKALWKKGYRYRKNYKNIPGSPDIAITKYKIAIFCDGEFFHGYNWEEKKNKIGTNTEYWIKKINRNIQRDKENEEALRNMEWTVIRFWGKQIKQNLDLCIEVIEEAVIEYKKSFNEEEALDIDITEYLK